jgi:REP element-mobilizing transposase RayT
MRKEIFSNGEYYHVYNRGVDKRTIFEDEYDFIRFLQSLDEFNTVEPIGSIYESSFRKDPPGSSASKSEKLVEIIAYCLNSNHYHLLLKQVSDEGIPKFMHRLSTGYTKYFNHKSDRSGSLFQGRFKAVHVDSNEYLLHLSVYVNLNDQVHQLGSSASKSSWAEYADERKGNKKWANICNSEVILEQFKSREEYKRFARSALKAIQEKKLLNKEKF